MPVRLIVTFTAQPGRADDFLRGWPERKADVEVEPGCDQYEMFRSAERPDVLVLLEEWSSDETFKAHGEMNRQRRPFGREFLVEGGMKVERFDT
jgi:quinol monooxygenase YgiN